MMCRVCMKPADISLTEKIGNFQIISAIRRVANIVISHEDSFPKHICQNCLEDLKVAFKFHQKCRSSDYKFRQYCSQDSEEQVSPIIHHDVPPSHQIEQNRSVDRTEQNKQQRKWVHVKKHQKSLVVENKETNKNKTQSINQTPKRIPDQFNCTRCNIQFPSKEAMLKHYRNQNCTYRPCPICGKLVRKLTVHKKLVHSSGEIHCCHICGKFLKTSQSLKCHLLVHSDKCAYPCPICPYKAKKSGCLRLHMRTHTGEKPYLCSQCPASFTISGNLVQHQRVHNSMDFECEECKKRFRSKKSLKDHYDAYHLNLRYQCNLCGRQLYTRKKLLDHELHVHNREKHKVNNVISKVIAKDIHESKKKKVYASQNLANQPLLTEDICLIVQAEQVPNSANEYQEIEFEE